MFFCDSMLMKYLAFFPFVLLFSNSSNIFFYNNIFFKYFFYFYVFLFVCVSFLSDNVGVITQGRDGSNQWVTEFEVYHSNDGSTWFPVANANNETVKK